MRIGVDARAAVEDPGGRGRVVRELVRALAGRDDPHEYRLYARAPWEDLALDERFAWRAVPGREPVWQVRAAFAAGRECDVFLACNSYVMAALLPIPGVPIVHDVMAPRRSLRRRPWSGLAEAAALAATIPRAAGYVAVSRTTAAALARRHPRARGRITVAPLGVSPAVRETDGHAAHSGPGGFVLTVGSAEPRKNLVGLARAYGLLDPALRREYPLVVAGETGSAAEPAPAALRALGAHVLGHVPDAQLAALYRDCTVFCFPSLAEGFGLPVAEAMAAGAPVAASRRASLPEVAGDAAVYFDPASPASMADALTGLLEDPGRRAELARRGRDRAAGLDWDRTATLVMGALERAARSQR